MYKCCAGVVNYLSAIVRGFFPSRTTNHAGPSLRQLHSVKRNSGCRSPMGARVFPESQSSWYFRRLSCLRPAARALFSHTQYSLVMRRPEEVSLAEEDPRREGTEYIHVAEDHHPSHAYEREGDAMTTDVRWCLAAIVNESRDEAAGSPEGISPSSKRNSTMAALTRNWLWQAAVRPLSLSCNVRRCCSAG